MQRQDRAVWMARAVRAGLGGEGHVWPVSQEEAGLACTVVDRTGRRGRSTARESGARAEGTRGSDTRRRDGWSEGHRIPRLGARGGHVELRALQMHLGPEALRQGLRSEGMQAGDHQVPGQSDLAASQGNSRTWLPSEPLPVLGLLCAVSRPESSNQIKESDSPHTPSFSMSAAGQGAAWPQFPCLANGLNKTVQQSFLRVCVRVGRAPRSACEGPACARIPEQPPPLPCVTERTCPVAGMWQRQGVLE